MKNLRRVTVALLLSFIAADARAYDRSAALAYSAEWWNTDFSGDNLVDHVNSPRHCSTCPYTWNWLRAQTIFGIEIPLYERSENDGDNSVSRENGADCSNFVSQVLKAGGIQMSGDGGRGGTYREVEKLGAGLLSIAQQTPLETANSAIPANGEPGDVIQFVGLNHSGIVVSTNPVRLRYHTSDRFNMLLTDARLAGYFPAIYHHITADAIAAASDSTPPTVVVRSGQTTVPNDGFASGDSLTIEVSDSGAGIRNLQVTRGAPIFDSTLNFDSGAGVFLLRDRTFRGSNFTYSLDLSGVPEGTPIFVHAYDAAGGLTLSRFNRSYLLLLVERGALHIGQKAVGGFLKLGGYWLRGSDMNQRPPQSSALSAIAGPAPSGAGYWAYSCEFGAERPTRQKPCDLRPVEGFHKVASLITLRSLARPSDGARTNLVAFPASGALARAYRLPRKDSNLQLSICLKVSCRDMGAGSVWGANQRDFLRSKGTRSLARACAKGALLSDRGVKNGRGKPGRCLNG